MQLTAHVSLEEMTRTKPGILNDPPVEYAGIIRRTAEKVTQARAIWTLIPARGCIPIGLLRSGLPRLRIFSPPSAPAGSPRNLPGRWRPG